MRKALIGCVAGLVTFSGLGTFAYSAHAESVAKTVKIACAPVKADLATRISAENKLGADYARLSKLHWQTSSAIVQVELQMAQNRLVSSQLAVAHGKCFSASDVHLAYEQIAASKQLVAHEIDRLTTAHE